MACLRHSRQIPCASRNDLARNRVNLNKVITQWPDMLKVAGSPRAEPSEVSVAGELLDEGRHLELRPRQRLQPLHGHDLDCWAQHRLPRPVAPFDPCVRLCRGYAFACHAGNLVRGRQRLLIHGDLRPRGTNRGRPSLGAVCPAPRGAAEVRS